MIILILLLTTLITTHHTASHTESNTSLQAYHSLEHVITTYVFNTCLQAHTSLEQVFVLYEYVIIPPFPVNDYIGIKQLQVSSYNSRKKNALQRHVEDEEHIHIILSKNTSNLITAWHSRLEVWSKHYQYPHLKPEIKDGHRFRHDDGKDQAHLAWLSSNKIRKKTQHHNAG
jgi:hypothetical protein